VPRRPAIERLRDAGTTVVALGPLTTGETNELLTGLLDGAPDAELRQLAQRAAGNPMYLRELATAVRPGDPPDSPAPALPRRPGGPAGARRAGPRPGRRRAGRGRRAARGVAGGDGRLDLRLAGRRRRAAGQPGATGRRRPAAPGGGGAAERRPPPARARRQS